MTNKPTNNIPFVLKGDEETLKKLQQKPSKEILEESKQVVKIAKEIFAIKKG